MKARSHGCGKGQHRHHFFSVSTLFAALVMIPLMVCAEVNLDGRTFATSADGKSDVLTFQDGTFQSSFWLRSGFEGVTYRSEISARGISFTASMINQNEHDIQWQGLITGDMITGSYLWTKKGWFLFGDSSERIQFKGSIQ